MARVKRGVTANKRHKKVLAQVKGHYGTNNRLYKRAHESLMRALANAYRDRRTRKRSVRRAAAPAPGAAPPPRVSRLVKNGAVGLAVLATARWLWRSAPPGTGEPPTHDDGGSDPR